jgi:hypothetical protein
MCKKLYLNDNYFVSRKAIEGCLYRTQLESKRNRTETMAIRRMLHLKKIIEKGQLKYFKSDYAGYQTKAMRRIIMAGTLLDQYSSNYH